MKGKKNTTQGNVVSNKACQKYHSKCGIKMTWDGTYLENNKVFL